jgi:hypothetical protein
MFQVFIFFIPVFFLPLALRSHSNSGLHLCKLECMLVCIKMMIHDIYICISSTSSKENLLLFVFIWKTEKYQKLRDITLLLFFISQTLNLSTENLMCAWTKWYIISLEKHDKEIKETFCWILTPPSFVKLLLISIPE